VHVKASQAIDVYCTSVSALLRSAQASPTQHAYVDKLVIAGSMASLLSVRQILTLTLGQHAFYVTMHELCNDAHCALYVSTVDI
jgi:hypothetical protein